ncbi:MAG TPA: pectin acetylesterase-family hydrolase [Polyangiaceae bacterium]|jgi:hypothetical protein
MRFVTCFARLGVLALLGTAGCLAQPAGDPSPEPGTPSAGGMLAAPHASTSVPVITPHVGGAPLGATPQEWTWVDVPGTSCANGTPTGVAVNVQPGASHLVFFLEGGGACDTAEDCWVQPTASNIASGYGVTQLAEDSTLGLPIFARSDPANPFADASYVFVPYCTGDLHAGTRVAQYVVGGQTIPTYHYGAKNLDLDLALLGGAFAGVEHVWLVGDSAGGFGTLVNHGAVASAFGVPTDVIDDSGPGIGDTGFPAVWGVRLPADCDTCAEGLGPLFLHDRAAFPSTRFAFLSYQVDSMLPGFYGSTESQVAGWLAQYEQELPGLPNAHSFVAQGVGHVVMSPGVEGETRAQILGWLAEMADGSPLWKDVAPSSSPSPI